MWVMTSEIVSANGDTEMKSFVFNEKQNALDEYSSLAELIQEGETIRLYEIPTGAEVATTQA